MTRVSGITIEKNIRGQARYARIDLRKFGNNELIEDFLDGQLAESCRNDESIPHGAKLKQSWIKNTV